MNNPKAYIWSSDYVSKYESLCSILQKFAALNYCNFLDVKKVFCVDFFSDRYTWPVQYRGYGSLEPFITNRLKNILNIDDDIVKYSINSPYRLRNDYYVSRQLRYCPVCIKSGFHSPLFQQGFIEKCPIHNEKLLTSCPSCNSHGLFSYSLDSPSFNFPYSCKRCQHNLWPIKDGYNSIHSISEQEFKVFKEYIIWGNKVKAMNMYRYTKHGFSANPLSEYLSNINDEAPDFWFQCGFYKNNKQHKSGFIKNNSKLVSCYTYGLCTKHIMTKSTSYHKYEPISLNFIISDEERVLYEYVSNLDEVMTYFLLFKSVRRYIYKRYIKKHKHILKEIRNNSTTICEIDLKFIYKLIYAFVAWEKYWLGRPRFFMNRLYNQDRIWINSLEQALYFYPTLKNIIISKNKAGDDLLHWLCHRLMSSIFLQTFAEVYEHNVKSIPNLINENIRMEIDYEISGKYNPIFLFVPQERMKHHRLFINSYPVLSILNESVLKQDLSHY